MANAILLVVLLSGQGPDPARLGRSATSFAEADAVRPAARALRDDLTRILREARLAGPGTGLLVVSLDQGDTLFAQNEATPLAPASNLKLFTTAAALHYLGPSFRFNTYLLADGAVRDGVLEGDLVLYGTGDPTLSERFGSRALEEFADTLVALGIREIRGDVVGDASYFGGSGAGMGWNPDYSTATYAAPASALSFAENIAMLEIRPGPAGERPTVRVVPGGGGIEVVNQLSTAAGGRSSVALARSGYEGPLTVRGRVSSRSGTWRRWLPVSDPPAFAAGALREALEQRGITILGAVRAVHDAAESPVNGGSLFAPGTEPGSPVLQVLAVHTSPPLLEVLDVVNGKSHNFMAEQVLRTLGRMVAGDGSIEGGTAALNRFARDVLGLKTAAFEAFDGSGLSPLNRVTAGATVRLLSFAAGAVFWQSYLGTLPQAGSPTGLRRMYRTPAEGRLWAKTGTIRQVSALSGYVRSAGGEWLAFSILTNETRSTGRAKAAEDRIGARLAAFDRLAGEAPDPPSR
jgi:D-alanyl-D-alanine carboxypeptidase/D-alanyl-D-alanine-endopeptidase (penicillin-binding protein 4)